MAEQSVINRLVVIYLFLSGFFGFGSFHATGLFGPCVWVSDSHGVAGKMQPVTHSWGADGFNPFNPGGVAANHIVAGDFFTLAGIFHLTFLPP